MNVVEITSQVLAGGTSQKVATSTTSAQSAAVGSTTVDVVVDALTFVRRGSNPTALSDGTDQVLIPNKLYRMVGHLATDKFAFIVPSGTGNAYITPSTLAG
jgi:hypothetical protein